MVNKKALYQPYMSLGLVCDGNYTGCAPTSHQQGLSFFLTTPVDGARTLHLYDINLRLKGVSKPVPSSWCPPSSSRAFSHIAAYELLTFAVIDNVIGVFHRLTPFTVWRSQDAEIIQLAVIGDVLVSIDSEANLIVWKLPTSAKDMPSKSGHIAAQIVLPSDFVVSAITHPQTYINKILLGAKDGRCMLVNLNTRKIVHIFDPFSSPITVLEPSPVVDVVAVGTQNGDVHLHNIRHDETVTSFHHSQTSADTPTDDMYDYQVKSAVRAISFRSDGIETIVTADAAGNVFVWDLNEQRLCSEARSVHPNGVMFAEFLAGEPILVTTGRSDNAVKVHVFDDQNDDARVLRSREGHHLPPTCVRFCGQDGLSMVSAGMDRELRLVSAVNDAKNRSFSQSIWDRRGPKAKKRQRRSHKTEAGDTPANMKRFLPHVTGIATRNTKERDEQFANIVTIHSGLKEAYLWRFQDGSSCNKLLKPPPRPVKIDLAFKRGEEKISKKRKKIERYKQATDEAVGTSVAISPCGNFGIIGLSNGRIHLFNLQSTDHQGVFNESSEGTKTVSPPGDASGDQQEWVRAHEGSVSSICVDGCGELVASVGTGDRTVKFWNLQTRKASGESITLPHNALKMIWCETSSLIAVAMEDFSILVYDVPTRRLARHFKGHEATIVDLCFDLSGRRIISASMDGSVQTWDLPSGCVVDVMRCREVPTSVSVGCNGDYIATTHANSLSIRLWLDTTRFGPVRDFIDGEVDMVGDMIEDGETEVGEELDAELDISGDEKNSGRELTALSDTIITLSSRPTSAWTVLSNMREITERNKPVAPPKKGDNAPFFLPTVKGLTMKFDVGESGEAEEDGGSEEEEGKGRVREVSSNWEIGGEEDNLSKFGRLVVGGKFDEAGRFLKEGNPAEVNAELRGLTGQRCIVQAAKLFIRALRERSSFELTQAHLSVFLSSQGRELGESDEGLTLLGELSELQAEAWKSLRGTFDSVNCLSAFLSGQV